MHATLILAALLLGGSGESSEPFPAVPDEQALVAPLPRNWCTSPDGSLVMWPVGTEMPPWVRRQQEAESLWRRPDRSWKDPMPASIPTGRYLDLPLERRTAVDGQVFVHPSAAVIDAWMPERNEAKRRTAAQRAQQPAYVAPAVPVSRWVYPVPRAAISGATAAPQSLWAAPQPFQSRAYPVLRAVQEPLFQVYRGWSTTGVAWCPPGAGT